MGACQRRAARRRLRPVRSATSPATGIAAAHVQATHGMKYRLCTHQTPTYHAPYTGTPTSRRLSATVMRPGVGILPATTRVTAYGIA